MNIKTVSNIASHPSNCSLSVRLGGKQHLVFGMDIKDEAGLWKQPLLPARRSHKATCFALSTAISIILIDYSIRSSVAGFI